MEKRNFGKITVLAACVLFASCFYDTDSGGGSSGSGSSLTSKTITTDASGTTYLVKINNTSSYIAAANTGYVSSVSRSIGRTGDTGGGSDGKTELPVPSGNDPVAIDALNARVRSDFSAALNRGRSARTANAVNASVSANPVKNDAALGQTKSFYIFDSETSCASYSATCKYVGSKCAVWFINNNSLVVTESSLDFSALGQKFDSICSLEEEYLGSHTYETKVSSDLINPVDKINIIVADLYGDAEEDQNSGVVGYFYQLDHFTQSWATSNYGSSYKSNESQIIYIDSYFYSQSADTVYSTLVHEYNHLLNFVQKTVLHGLDYETWYTEMLAMVAEDMFQGYLGISDDDSPKGRTPYFDEGYCLGFTSWYSDDYYVYYSYANAYMYGAYLARNFGGTKLISAIATNAYKDGDSITAALASCGLSYDFDYTVANEYQIIQTYYDSSASGYTVNKTVDSSSSDRIYFKGFSLKYTTTSGNNEPALYYATPRGQVPLGPQGFSVHYVGDSISSFTYTYYADSGITTATYTK